MLKNKGPALVNKLRAILLMEVDFNMHNKIIFGSRMMEQARTEGVIPAEHYSKKGPTTKDGKFSGILLADISRQQQQGMALIFCGRRNLL